LNYAIDYWKPTLLLFTVHHPSTKLFDYFISKGADINLIADSFIYETPEDIENENS